MLFCHWAVRPSVHLWVEVVTRHGFVFKMWNDRHSGRTRPFRPRGDYRGESAEDGAAATAEAQATPSCSAGVTHKGKTTCFSKNLCGQQQCPSQAWFCESSVPSAQSAGRPISTRPSLPAVLSLHTRPQLLLMIARHLSN